ncbi:Uu.00g143640.m01.CDS01 [Anthostomella pinea]|uniref:Uu.00g143640.m01.CDS01 n=1 Tax=Anthostomella pinea TaxID=933095 RepID=A0AAI8VQP9_9PEZI|nr:Uu.00g143640.m01.CDS01 [Anthostomella pinea]
MRLTSATYLAVLSGLASSPRLARGSPVASRQEASSCTEPASRPEWRTLPDDTKAEYISAVKCLTTKPSRIGLDTTLYDDFPYVHAQLNLDIHFVAQFLPWHRLFVHLYETALRDDCTYTGPMPYWDWMQDSGTFPSSPIFSNSSTSGFGGTSAGGWVSPARPNPLTSCVTDGAFADFNVTYYTLSKQSHCLNRAFNNGTGTEAEANWEAADYSTATIANITDNSADFKTFWPALENTPHGAIHAVIGGDMVPQTSPNDPLFFLHHAQVDRLWWIWQQVDPETRNADFSGNKNQAPDETPAALTDVMPYLGLGPNMTVSTVMTIENDVLCYTYV